MKITKSFLSVLLLTSITTFGQPINGRDFKNRTGLNYWQPIQIDSSDNFIIAKRIDKSDSAMYRTKLDYFGNPSYWAEEFYCTDIIIYNSKTTLSKNLFKKKPTLVLTIANFTNENASNIGAILKKHLLFLAKTDDLNKDGILDYTDPLYIFLSNKSGDSLTQITPTGYNVVSWSLAKKQNVILVKLVRDKNGDNKYNDEDELFYQIDLNDDISKIKCTPMTL